MTPCVVAKRGGKNPSTAELVHHALGIALTDSNLNLEDIDGLIAMPSLAEPRFMYAHYYASVLGILPRRNVTAITLDTGGSAPITALITARNLILRGDCKCVAILVADTVSSLPIKEFLKRADSSPIQQSPNFDGKAIEDPATILTTPAMPRLYSRVTEW